LARGGPLLALLLLSACAAPYVLVGPGRQDVAGALSVAPAMSWNRVAAPPFAGAVEGWTQDGQALDSLVFIAGAADGEPLLQLAKREKGAPTAELAPFRSRMSAIDVAELFQATLARVHATPLVEITAVLPATLGGVPGFRFEIRYVGRDDVERSGTGIGAVRGGRLYLLWFEGTRLNYHARYLPEFERIAASVRFIGTSIDGSSP